MVNLATELSTYCLIIEVELSRFKYFQWLAI